MHGRIFQTKLHSYRLFGALAFVFMFLVCTGCPHKHPRTTAKDRTSVGAEREAIRGADWRKNRDINPPVPVFKPTVSTAGDAAKRIGGRRKAGKPVPFRPSPPLSTAGVPKARARGLAAGDRSFAATVRKYFGTGRKTRLLIETDKPLYRPGETVWVRAAELRLLGNRPAQKGSSPYHYKLMDPRGSVLHQKLVEGTNGQSYIEFDLPAQVAGGQYTLRVTGRRTWVSSTKKIMVGVYQAPRIKKTLAFVRKAYGAGDTVQAVVKLKKGTGGPLAGQTIRLIARLDNKVVKRWQLKTDKRGEALIAFPLPARLKTDDGLLTVLVPKAGVTESISRPVPLVMTKIKVGFFPEGGKAVLGLPSRVYFAVRRTADEKPVDIEGEIRDSIGAIVARVRTFHDGMGRFVYTPRPRTGSTRPAVYHLHVTRPAGIAGKFRLPPPAGSGVTMQWMDDFKSAKKALTFLVHATKPTRVAVSALQYETLVAHRAYSLRTGSQVIRIPLRQKWRGIVRVTLFDARYRPLAERLVFRNRGRSMKIRVGFHKKNYRPRDTVRLKLTALSPAGRPIKGARLAVSVSDDRVLSFADDHEPHFLAQRYLTGQLTGAIHKPNFYFDPKEPKAPRALDLVMGTHGYRDFVWKKVLAPKKPRPTAAGAGADPRRRRRPKDPLRLKPPPRPKPRPRPRARPRPRPRPRARPRPAPRPHEEPPAAQPFPRKHRIVIAKHQILIMEKIYFMSRRSNIRRVSYPILDVVAATMKYHPGITKVCMDGHTDTREATRRRRRALSRRRAEAVRQYLIRKGVAARRLCTRAYGGKRPVGRNWTAMGRSKNRRVEFTIMERLDYDAETGRRFPTKFYKQRGPFKGVRTDFRDTVYWNPAVKTDGRGRAEVSFGLSDAVTSFRVRVSGVGGGVIGLEEKVLSSRRPFFMVVKAPMEVSSGDGMALPLTVANNSNKPVTVRITAKIPKSLQLVSDPAPTAVRLAARTARTYFYPVRVVAKRGRALVSFHAASSGLSDAFEHVIRIRPRGFPRVRGFSGTLDGKTARVVKFSLPPDFGMSAPLASVSLYPDPLATMTKGMQSMIREPYGCFEQASSANYPNVMILKYLKQRGIKNPGLLQRTHAMLQKGYRKLAGYETPSRGYEWWGKSPAHESLTAYGILQFTDMQAVFPEVDRQMIRRTARWLHSRRDGKGGYRLLKRRLDSFGHAAPAISAAYITWALAESGRKGLGAELNLLKQRALSSRDPYVVALAANAWQKASGARSPEATRLLKRLVGLQRTDGSFKGLLHSITNSTGQNLHVETTALATVAILKSPAHINHAHRAVRWLRSRRSPAGGFGATQATVLALRALIAYQKAFRDKPAGGIFEVTVNGKNVGTRTFGAGTMSDITFKGLHKALRSGPNKVAILLRSKRAIPFSLGVKFHSRRPMTAAGVPLKLSTRLSKTKVKMGHTVRLSATARNQTARGLAMTLVRIRFPGALRPQHWQLKALHAKKRFAFYETRGREVTLYFRQLPPRAKKTIHLDLVARVTGNYVGPASTAYPYYTNDKKSWTAPLAVSVTP